MFGDNTNIIDISKYDVDVKYYSDYNSNTIVFSSISDKDINDMYGYLMGNVQLYKDSNKTYKKRTKFLKDVIFHFKTNSYYLENLTILEFYIGSNYVDDNFVTFQAYCDVKNSKELDNGEIRTIKIDKFLNDIC